MFDKYEPYIWAAYGVSALALGGFALFTLWRARAARRALERLEGQRKGGS